METSCKNLVKENNDRKSDRNSSNQQVKRFGGIIDTGDTTEIMEDEPLAIMEMPDSIFLHIFSYLPFSSIGSVAQVCLRWSQISSDELLWKETFLRHYKLPFDTKFPAKANSWRSEFKRLYYHTPCLLSEERKEHRDEVLHISFSHDGTMFATCSKDGFFKVWECDHPCRLLFEKDMMSSFSWKFTQFSQFNESDTCLLVSGVYFGSLSTSGEIAVFNLLDGFNMQCRVTNKPYDVFGAWYDNDHLLSGTLYITSGDFRSVSAVWLSKASQEVESEMESVSMVLYRFENRNSSSIRLLHVAEVERDDEDGSDQDNNKGPRVSMEQGENNPSSLESMKNDNDHSRVQIRSLSTNTEGGDNPSLGESDQATGFDSRLLDKLLKKSIAENEFDLENEDDTDEDTDGETAERLVRPWKEHSCHSSSDDNQMTTEDFLNAFIQPNCCCDIEGDKQTNSVSNSMRDEYCVSDNHSFIVESAVSNLPDFDKRECSVIHGVSSSKCSLEGMESCSSSSGCSFSKGLSGGFNGLGINNSNSSSHCCDDCPMADEEGDGIEGKLNESSLPNEQCVHSSTASTSDDVKNLLQTESEPCDKCRGKDKSYFSGNDKNIDFDIERNNDGNSVEDGCAVSSKNSCVITANVGLKDNCDITSHKDVIFDTSISAANGNRNACGIASLSNLDFSEMDSQNKIVDQSTEGKSELQKSYLSICSKKVMDDASTQTEESIASQASSIHSSMAQMSRSMSHSSSLSREATPKRVTDKLLIYTWGSETYIPHKIGIKRMKRSDFCKSEVKTRQSSMLLPDVMENLHNVTEDRRDSPDISIDMHGHIVGLSLSPDNKYLYVNCRAWPKNYIIVDPQECPPLAQQVEIFTIDLKTFQFVGPVLRSHKAYTHSDECFFLNLDVSDDYVVSGAEDRKGYIWDRHYGICLGQFEHRNVVNCMAACPSDPEVAISVSDDHTFKVWMSRHRLKEVEKMGKSGNQLTHRNSLD